MRVLSVIAQKYPRQRDFVSNLLQCSRTKYFFGIVLNLSLFNVNVLNRHEDVPMWFSTIHTFEIVNRSLWISEQLYKRFERITLSMLCVLEAKIPEIDLKFDLIILRANIYFRLWMCYNNTTHGKYWIILVVFCLCSTQEVAYNFGNERKYMKKNAINNVKLKMFS